MRPKDQEGRVKSTIKAVKLSLAIDQVKLAIQAMAPFTWYVT